jgi:adenylate kinase family enzyme
VRRVSVVGNSGSGKSTLARAIASRLSVPHIELDSLHHQADWTPLDPLRLRDAVARSTENDGWVVDGNYSGVRDLVWSRADTVLWLDLPRTLIMWQVVSRTLQRIATGEELWNGNRERWRNLFTLDRQESVVVWAWVQHRTYRERYAEAMRDPAWSHLRFVRLRSRRDTRRLLGGL